MRHTTKLLVLAAAILGGLGIAAAGWAYWTASGSGSASATVGTLTAPGKPTVSNSSGTVSVGWSASTVTGGGLVQYHVERSTNSGTTWSDACRSTAVAPISGTSCSDTPGVGTYNYRVTAVYLSWTQRGPLSDPVTASKAPTTTTLTVTDSPATYGNEQTLTFGATVTSSLPGTPGGTVTVKAGTTVLCTLTLPGTCSLTSAQLGAATYTSVAGTYNGDSNFTGSTSTPTQSFTVNQATATTSLSLAQTSVVYGNESAETFTATVTPQFSGTPSGTVDVKNGSTTLCTITLPGTCTLTNTQLGASGTAYSVTATYNGDINFSASTSSPAKTFTVNKATPAITWATPSAITYGTALSATQLNATTTVAGSFVYTPASGAVLNAGTQTLSVTFTPTDTANYNSNTGGVNLQVNKATQTISFTAPATGTVGTPATLSATGGASTSPVVFTIDGTSGAGVCNVTGTNGTTLNYTAPGTCKVDANQASDANYNAAPQVQRSITVTAPAPTAVSVTIANGSGGTAGKPEAGDTISIVYSQAIQLSSVCSTWSSGTLTNISVKMEKGNGQNTNDLTVTGCSGALHFGTLTTPSGQWLGNATATWASSTMTWNSTTLTLQITLGGTVTGTAPPTVTAATTYKYTPDAGITNTFGTAISSTPVTTASMTQF